MCMKYILIFHTHAEKIFKKKSNMYSGVILGCSEYRLQTIWISILIFPIHYVKITKHIKYEISLYFFTENNRCKYECDKWIIRKMWKINETFVNMNFYIKAKKQKTQILNISNWFWFTILRKPYKWILLYFHIYRPGFQFHLFFNSKIFNNKLYSVYDKYFVQFNTVIISYSIKGKQ